MLRHQTIGGKNIKTRKIRIKKSSKRRKPVNYTYKFIPASVDRCKTCSKPICKKTKTGLCIQCLNASRRKFNVTKAELEFLVKTETLTAIGLKFGVSDNAIRKRLKRLKMMI